MEGWELEVEYQLSDKRGEYNSAKFETFCEEYRTIMQRTVSCTPQQNKVAERMNQTLSERFRNFIQAYEKCFGKRQSAQLHNTICTYIFDIVLRFYVIPCRRILGDFLEGVLWNTLIGVFCQAAHEYKNVKKIFSAQMITCILLKIIAISNPWFVNFDRKI